MRACRSVPALLSTIALLAAAGSASAGAQVAAPTSSADSGTLVLTQGQTEILRERYVRRGGVLEGEMTTSAGQRASYTATLLPDGRISRFEAREYGAASASAPAQVATVTFTGDSIRVEASADGTPAKATFAARAGTLPYLNPSPALMGQIVHRARAERAGAEQVPVSLFILGMGGQAVPATVTFGAEDRAILTVGNVAAELVVDAAGNVRSGSVVGQGISIQRAP